MKPAKRSCKTPDCENIQSDTSTEYCYRCSCRDPRSHNAGREHGQANCHCLLEEPVKWNQPFTDQEKENAACELVDILGDYLFDPEDAWLAARGIITYLLPESEHDIARVTVLNGLEAVDRQHAQKRIERVEQSRKEELLNELTQLSQELGLYDETEGGYQKSTKDDSFGSIAEEEEHIISMIAAAFEQENLPENQININHLARTAFEIVANYYDPYDEIAAESEYIRNVDRDMIKRTTEQLIKEGPATDLDEEDDSLKGISPARPSVHKAGTVKMTLTNPKRGHGSDTTVTSAEVSPPAETNPTPDYSTAFDQLFYKYHKLREIVITGYDVTVFFTDSDEPFPLTSLRGHLRDDIEAVVFRGTEQGIDQELYEFVEAIASGPCQCIPDAIGHFCRAHKANAVLRRYEQQA